ncbi:DMSO/selenate family reductase complex B subunit [Mannheimia pernigra]|uniref:DMSO/selenate family reductase complex B subunit n=1 Tax=Mannheimia pernigra TaxID=111844 RepID=UPI0013180433|nr:DMSO/selenate family reductase complex B subunit [Mannheimia pernigra]QHB18333.1 dimethylsulfoxide reductase subunit B [Mannheimia pernigra]
MSKKQYGFYIDSQRCTGCKTCELACKDYKDLSPDVSFRRIYEFCGGDWKAEGDAWTQDVFSYYLSISCNHCDNPACASVCPSGAMHKREDGFVVVNQDVCIGCQYCSMACPYGAPQFNQRTGRMTKCDGCFERVEQGLKPMCVESCPLRALDLLPMDELREKYGNTKDVAPLPPSSYTNPNIALRLNSNAKPTDFDGGFLANPKEV